MSTSATQDNREIAIDTPLGEDVLLLKSVAINEQMGRLFQMEADLLSETKNINFDNIVGENVTMRLNLVGGDVRYFNGFVSRFVQTEDLGGYSRYRATIVPWLWFLTRTSDCRIFQDMTVPDIIKQVFGNHGFNDFKDSLNATYRTWPYCVQYRETDFNFVSRLMEQEGIYYFFEHENGKHTLVLADSASAHTSFSGYDEILFRAEGGAGTSKGDINKWVIAREVQSGAYALNEFDFEKPKTDLQAKSCKTRNHAGAEFEIYDYPGAYAEHADGQTYADLRIGELQAQHEVLQGQGLARGLATGYTFTMDEHSRGDQNREYLITSTTMFLDGGDFEAAQKSAADFFSCQFTAVPKDEVFRSARITPKPLVQGPQTAIVVGKAGEEIWTDQYGRVKLQFHWDRYGKADETSSCWVRVSQAWAGKKWGSIYTPRIGQEVIVEFLEGDPDRPIITGRVYNAQSMPPYPLPDNATKSTLKSLSSKGGDGFNEIRFEDKKGSEEIFIHAEKNQEVRTKADVHEWVGNERHLYVKTDQIESVDGGKHLKVKGDTLAAIDGEVGLTIKSNRLVEIKGNENLTVGGDQNQKNSGGLNIDVANNLNEKAGQNVSIQAGQNLFGKAAQNIGFEGGSNVHIKGGMNVVIEAGLSLTIKAGSNFIVIDSSGVAISGMPSVKINSGGSAGSGSGCSPDDPAAAQKPDAPKEVVLAVDDAAGEKDDAATAPVAPTPVQFSYAATIMQTAAAEGTPFTEPA
ncbi:MAG: Rhs element Vgr protein [Pedosphaera sp.]|nr:Rhs element Vgr protein [Pedosphaera sp.]